MNKSETSQTIERPPVIVIMGHIDHGKSTLLDYVRKSNIVAGEAGGITQHTGSYEVIHETPKGEKKKITFIDTPGHAAFSEMRVRGAIAADIAILIISAEEGVKAQTLEALKAIMEAKIPYIVAITKIDKPNANVDRVRQDLATNDVYVEGYGGTIPCVPISSKSGEGIPELLDMILLVAELGEFKADPTLPASGVVLEASLDAKRGASATLLIREGTLHQGDFLAIGNEATPVRSMQDFNGARIESATVCAPVQIMGFKTPPKAGAVFMAAKSKKEAEAYAETQAKVAATARLSATGGESGVVLPIILKADFLGTLEAIEGELKKLTTPEVTIKLVHTGIGNVSEADMKVAESSEHPIIIGFNVKVDNSAQGIAEKIGVQPRLFSIIYEITDMLKEEIAKLTPKVVVEQAVGKVKILKTFGGTKDKQIVGGAVTEGMIIDGKQVKVIRQNTEVARGLIVGLQQQKIKVKEVPADTQFGAMIECKLEIAPGDILEVFDIIENS
ncbi:MAG: translation initiation factor IF-2 [Candidatus Paceibacterota bacterium]